ncbi:MAG: 4a-hydroxytetrahydrobiopterin dehydratase [Anaerolineales bacterium]|jgi:4a-hydroxytetrahydrobiopterin dehydratase|nr:4a-hydroxytetrahydrobiopterin dehydratase [Anaerolineales bacterium]
MTTRLSDPEVERFAAPLPDWQVQEGALVRTFQLPSFAHAVLMIGAVGQLAEAAGHHPDLALHGYNKLTITLTTHSAGGLTEKDFDLARQIQAIPQRGAK